MSGTDSFFEERRQQSKIKSEIVSKYFEAWANIMKKHVSGDRLGFIDLFCGPGTYEDGNESTPIRILKIAIDDPDLQRMLVTVFNDKNKECLESLRKSIESLPGHERLKYQPRIINEEVDAGIEEEFNKIKLIPTIIFIDPWGYKGLTLELLRSFLSNWGCEVIFFFNYNRINPGLGNSKVIDHMDNIFGEERAHELRSYLKPLEPPERELAIVNELMEALKEIGGKYTLAFRFKDENGKRTSHHLVFAAKHILGYEIMKDIMAVYSSKSEQGVPSFEYNLSDERYPALFELSRPLDDLEDMLLDAFAGQTLTRKEIYELHSIGKSFIKKNYKDILLKMEGKGIITAEPKRSDRRVRNGEPTFAESVKVTFPGR